MNLFSPECLPIVKQKKSNGALHPLDWCRHPVGSFRIEVLSDYDQNCFGNSLLVDSSGREWKPSQVERHVPVELPASL